MNKIVEIARREIGVTEAPPNSNQTKYGAWFGMQNVAWCGIFVSWVYDQAKFNLGNMGYRRGFAGCQTAYNLFLSKNEITTHPQPGDIVLFDWNADHRFDHTGIFIKDNGDNKTFTSVEGNTSYKNDSNGGAVMERIRNYSTATFVHPKVLDKK